MPLRGVKRFSVVFMLVASPFAYSQPISVFQEAPLPSVTPAFVFIEAKEAVPARVKRTKKLPAPKQPVKTVHGVASWYSQADAFINRHTANGEIFNDQAMTCASWDHPFGTRLKVTNTRNGKSVVCRVNDRGPNKRLKRAIDLLLGAFREIADPRRGLIHVSIQKSK